MARPLLAQALPRVSVQVPTLALLLALAPLQAYAGEPLAVVVRKDWAGESSIALSRLRRIYLGALTRMGGNRIKRFHLPNGTPARDGFRAAVLRRSERAMESYWIEQALRGGSVPPRELPSASHVLRELAGGPGRIGYVPASALQADDASGLVVLKVISESGKSLLPSDPEYPLRSP